MVDSRAARWSWENRWNIGVMRELKEETGLTVRIVEMIEVFDRIYEDEADAAGGEAI